MMLDRPNIAPAELIGEHDLLDHFGVRARLDTRGPWFWNLNFVEQAKLHLHSFVSEIDLVARSKFQKLRMPKRIARFECRADFRERVARIFLTRLAPKWRSSRLAIGRSELVERIVAEKAQ